MKPLKVVYVLGAGFSRDAGFPLQREILKKIDDVNFLNIPQEVEEMFSEARYEIRKFIDNNYGEGQIPELEDIFTILDQSILFRENCGGYSWETLDKIREHFKKAILILFHGIGEKTEVDAQIFYDRLADFIISSRRNAGINGDPLSVISLNWDCYLENTIYQRIHKMKLPKKVDVDYCCYTNPLTTKSFHTPSVLQKAKKIFNVKLLKLHGSANWLVCSNCKRLFTRLGEKAGAWHKYLTENACPECSFAGASEKRIGYEYPKLEPFFISPTFTKVFDNVHIQMTWHNAYIELSQADKVVFVGYSFPLADYHFRTLLKRSIKPETKIEVVLTKVDMPFKKNGAWQNIDRRDRYAQFFGMSEIKFYWGGVRKYFNAVFKKGTNRSAL